MDRAKPGKEQSMAEKNKIETNRFHLLRFEIARISEELGMDTNFASYELAHRLGWDVGAGGAELEEYQAWLAHVRDLQRRTTKVNNLVAKYFGF